MLDDRLVTIGRDGNGELPWNREGNGQMESHPWQKDPLVSLDHVEASAPCRRETDPDAISVGSKEIDLVVHGGMRFLGAHNNIMEGAPRLERFDDRRQCRINGIG